MKDLPLIVKLIIFGVAAFFSIFIVFSSIPSYMFGFETSDSDAVIEVNQIAQSTGSYFGRYETLRQEIIDEIITGLTSGTAYDDVVTTQSTEAMNSYWFVAIYSSVYGQDLYSMSDSDFKDKIRQSITCSTITEEYAGTDENGDEVTLIRLCIDIRQLPPEEYMELLQFDDEQKNWATLMYRVTAEDQYYDTNHPDYIASAGVNYGDLVYSHGGMDVVYFNQADSRWGDEPYGKTGTIASSACGPTCLSIVVSTLTDQTADPSEMSAWAYANGYRCEGNGSYHSLIPEGARHFGLQVEGATAKDAQKIIDALSSGEALVIAIMTQGHFTDNGHFIVLRGVTEDSKILVADPISTKRSEQAWDLSIILNEASRRAGASGPFWVITTGA